MVPSEFVDAYAKLRKDGVVAFSKSAVAYLQRSGPRNRLIIKTIPNGYHLLGLYIRFGHRIRPLSFTDADPFKIVWIDPDRIIEHTNDSDTPAKFGNIIGGNWDQNLPSFENHLLYRSIEERFLNGVSWKETELYEQFQAVRSSSETVWGRRVNSDEDIEARLSEIDDLYEMMKKEDYRTQKELYSVNRHTEDPHDAVHPLLNEIGVDIGRDGTFYWKLHGLHRLAVAKTLSVDAVGVQILNRHTEWQQLRNELRYGDCERRDIQHNHPDLQDILD